MSISPVPPQVPKPATDRVLSVKAIVWGGVFVGVIAIAAAVLLVNFYGTEAAAPQLEAIRVASTIVLGAGGAVALILAARRQRSTELTLQENARIAAENATDRAKDLAQRENAAEDVRLDATERRITDLYTKAADQLGSPKAAVRLAGLYALERLANDTPSQRQTIVNVICAYLRMPYVKYEVPEDDESPEQYARYQENRQEREVRHTAQEILTRGVSWRQHSNQWSDMSLNLAGAYIEDFNLHGCTLAYANFSGAMIVGDLSVFDCEFTGPAIFDNVVIERKATFQAVRFIGERGHFLHCHFLGGFLFEEVTFTNVVSFRDLDIRQWSRFKSCTFPSLVDFFGGMPADSLHFLECSGGILRMANIIFSSRISFEKINFKGIKIHDGTLISKGTTWHGDLPEGFRLQAQEGSEYEELTARVGDYRIDKNADD